MAKSTKRAAGRGPKVVEFKPDREDVKTTEVLLGLAKEAVEAHGAEAACVIIVGRETWVGGFTSGTRSRERLLGVLTAHGHALSEDILEDIDDLGPLPDDLPLDPDGDPGDGF